MTKADIIYQELKDLPDSLVSEVLDFVKYIEYRHGLSDDQSNVLSVAQEPVMQKIWDNPQDEIWNDV